MTERIRKFRDDFERAKFTDDSEVKVVLQNDLSTVSSANPLPISGAELDLINNPVTVWTITRPDGQPDSETITLVNGDVYERTFTYTNNLLTTRSKWVKQ